MTRDHQKLRPATTEAGFTLIELLMVVGIIGVLAAIAVHSLFSARAAANEASAVGSLRALNSGQNAFRSTCGSGSFSTSVATLVTSEYVSPDANLSPKSGFLFALAPGDGSVAGLPDCTGGATRSGYYFEATPVSALTGRRSFATNQAGTVWQAQGATAPVEPFVATPTVGPIQ